jgi:hypothetical protein
LPRAIIAVCVVMAATSCFNFEVIMTLPNIEKIRSPRRRFGVTFAALVLVLTTGVGVAVAQSIPSMGELANGPFSHMHMLLEKTVLKVDVAKIEVAVDKPTQEKLTLARSGKAFSPTVESELAKIVLSADEAIIQMKFVRDVSLGQWIDGVRESLEKAVAAGLLSPALRKTVSDGLPNWFKAAEARGLKTGDRIIYRIKPSSLRSMIVQNDGKVVVDRTDEGADKADMALASYFAPGTDYRTLLLQSLK